MTELKNEFSWSKTRDEVFKTCSRQYWFAYYGYWNGWLDKVQERTHQIYILKKLKNSYITVSPTLKIKGDQGFKIHRGSLVPWENMSSLTRIGKEVN